MDSMSERLSGPSMLTLAEVAAALRVHAETIRRWCRAGQITHVRHGRKYRFPPEVLCPRACAADQEEACQSAEGTDACTLISTHQADAELERLLRQTIGGKLRSTTTSSKPNIGRRND